MADLTHKQRKLISTLKQEILEERRKIREFYKEKPLNKNAVQAIEIVRTSIRQKETKIIAMDPSYKLTEKQMKSTQMSYVYNKDEGGYKRVKEVVYSNMKDTKNNNNLTREDILKIIAEAKPNATINININNLQ